MYNSIFKRISFHEFRGIGEITPRELEELQEFIDNAVPLDREIRTRIRIVPALETSCRRGAEYCILFYSEKKNDCFRNIGYIGEQIDLNLAEKDIGALWFGLGKTKEAVIDDMDFIIMIAIAKMPRDKFRKQFDESMRKPLGEIWIGDTMGVAEVARFAPSTANTQPWLVENSDGMLSVYRCREPEKPGSRRKSGKDTVGNLNRIDMGIFMYILETCLAHEGLDFTRTLYSDTDDDAVGKILTAEYQLKAQQRH